ncbi:DUF6624 domain-containing protein [Mucilaginibacter sp. OK098]|uniref:DUF6624 domain-containing protein n=1 Tax=Mucilaginibacter sp. OK098 TaxID=1855297 RepID=UPI00091A9749|nr:DUF6624 domain-containing protein [Mucilaginibacter sp. OK098]SHN12612.1 hypothetical protein SAMN05216524_105422 [Mucilaginibacter sp. OK098]
MRHTFLALSLTFLATTAFAQVNTFTIDSSKLNNPLMLVLDTIYKADQGSRYRAQDLSKAKATAAKVDSAIKAAHIADSLNIIKVTQIIDKYGWLGPQDVGMNGSQALFLVIQHANLATQQKYLPMIRTAVKDGKTLSSNLALLEDRVNMREGKNQIYGSQVFRNKSTGKMCFYPIADPDHVDERRKTMGLQPIADYAKLFNLAWDVEAYKKDLPEIENAAKAQKF